MRYRLLGRSGLKVSPLCLGTMMFGAWGNTDHDDSIRIIHRALDAGINFIDTAQVYGTEGVVGRALKTIPRDQVVIATKAQFRGKPFVFDCVAHVFNMDKKNALGSAGESFIDHLYAFHATLTPEGLPVMQPDEYMRQWSPEEIHRIVFDESDTDMLVAQPLPLTDLFVDGLSPWEECARMAQTYPDDTVFWGSVNPMEGRRALDLMEIQVHEHGAKGFKLYNTRYDYGSPMPWRMDDPQIAFPIFEKALELGIDLIGGHKGVPLGPQAVEHTPADGPDRRCPDGRRRGARIGSRSGRWQRWRRSRAGRRSASVKG